MTIKKRNILFVVIAAFLISFVMGETSVTVTAAEETQTITIHNRKYDELPSEIQNTGDEMNFTGEALPGSVFTAYDVTSTYWTTYRAASGTASEKEAAAIAAAEIVDTSSLTGSAFPATDSEGIAKNALPIKSGSDHAIYLIKQTGFPSGIVPSKSAPLIVGLPSYNKGGVLRKEVHIYPKNDYQTNHLKFVKYGVEVDGKTAPLEGAKFILKDPNGKFYNSKTHKFDSDEKDATALESTKEGIVSVEDLVLESGTYSFFEVDSAVSTKVKQDDNNPELFHYKTNPKVIATVSDELIVTKYEYYDKDLSKKEIFAPFSDDNRAKAYNYKVPKVEKEVDDEKVEQGQVITYTIKQKIPEDIENYKNYCLIDEYDSRLELRCTPEKIKASVRVDGNLADKLSPVYSNSGNSFRLTFDPANLRHYKNQVLSFVATMKVKTGTDLSTIDNDAVFENTFRDSKDKQEVITYGKRFEKVDNKTNKTLPGAEFVIKEANTFMQLQDENGKKIDSITGDAHDYTVVWVAAQADATRLISDAAGKFSIYGLDNNEENHYTLVEIKAPDGYISSGDIQFTADNCTKTLKVENKVKGILPMTGGMGLVGILTVGILAIVGGVSYFRKRRVLD